MRIWHRHNAKDWYYSSVKQLFQHYKETKTMDRKKLSGRPVTVVTKENQELVEELICSQEEREGGEGQQ